MFLVSLSCVKKNVYDTASFRHHPHKAAPLLCHVDSGESLVRAGRLSSEISLSRSDNRNLYTSVSIIKFSAGRRVSQFATTSERRNILPEKKENMLWYVHTLGCTRGIRRLLHIKCQHSSSYYVSKNRNRCTVEEAGMTAAVAYSIDCRDELRSAVKPEKLPAQTHSNIVVLRVECVPACTKVCMFPLCMSVCYQVFKGVYLLRVSHCTRRSGHSCL